MTIRAEKSAIHTLQHLTETIYRLAALIGEAELLVMLSDILPIMIIGENPEDWSVKP